MSKFNLSFQNLLSFDMGELVPIGLKEVVPGDKFRHSTSALIRLQPLLAPMMHRADVFIHHWFVQTRNIWEDFEDFITGGPDGTNASVRPTIELSNGTDVVGSLTDYLGVPINGALDGKFVSALPYRAYAQIFNFNYRDKDLTAEAPISLASGVDVTTTKVLRRVCWEKDYFTSSRPFAQKGPDVTLPLGTSAPVTGGDPIFVNSASDGTGGLGDIEAETVLGTVNVQTPPAAPGAIRFDGPAPTGLVANLAGATSATIRALRVAAAQQVYQENNERYGSDYKDMTLHRFGVRSPDGRAGRPEYLGGGKQPLQISEVLQTAPTTDGDDAEGVGNLKGHGIGTLKTNTYQRFFTEHGYVMTLMFIRPKAIYMDGLERDWSRLVKEDYFTPELQHVGQQEVLNKEVFYANASPDARFGFQDKYDEYRRSESTVHGEFRGPLNFWHMARSFVGSPSLNDLFVQCEPTKRVFAVETNDTCWVMVSHNIHASRPLLSKVGSSFLR